MQSVSVIRSSDAAYKAIKKLIGRGRFDNTGRIEEIPLAKRLGISRTPVREALTRLEAEGLVGSKPNRGFHVITPDADLVRQSYPVLAALESMALEVTAPITTTRLSQLRELVQALARESTPAQQYELDHAFHRLLIRDCGNERLLKLIEVERVRAQRFDGAHRRGTFDKRGTCDEHLAILRRLEQRDFPGAAELLRKHWLRGIETVTKWMESSS